MKKTNTSSADSSNTKIYVDKKNKADDSKSPDTISGSTVSLEQLVRENLILTREIYSLTKKTKRYIVFGQAMTVVKILLILGPIVLAFVYLPNILAQALGTYSELLGDGTGSTLFEGGSVVQDILNNQATQ
jgi:hypothetical protein